MIISRNTYLCNAIQQIFSINFFTLICCQQLTPLPGYCHKHTRKILQTRIPAHRSLAPRVDDASR